MVKKVHPGQGNNADAASAYVAKTGKSIVREKEYKELCEKELLQRVRDECLAGVDINHPKLMRALYLHIASPTWQGSSRELEAVLLAPLNEENKPAKTDKQAMAHWLCYRAIIGVVRGNIGYCMRYSIAQSRAEGKHVKRDLKRAVDLGSTLALSYLADKGGHILLGGPDALREKARERGCYRANCQFYCDKSGESRFNQGTKKLVKAGYSDAIFWVAWEEAGYGDPVESMNLYHQAMALGDDGAMMELGRGYMNGCLLGKHQVEKDVFKGACFLNQSVMTGRSPAVGKMLATMCRQVPLAQRLVLAGRLHEALPPAQRCRELQPFLRRYPLKTVKACSVGQTQAVRLLGAKRSPVSDQKPEHEQLVRRLTI